MYVSMVCFGQRILSESLKNPTVIQLTFTPKGDGESSCEYQLSDKRDMCVVCGKDSELTRHHIVEYEYRKHMPEAYKSHNSYDVVLFCSICHAKYEIEAFKIKKQLSIKYDAPINGRGWYNDVKLVKLKKAAAALIKHRSKLPLKRIEELESLLKTYVGDVELASSLLQKVAEMTTIVKTEEYMSHGEGVILKVEDCQDFIEMWRSHFLEVMKPKFLHHAWTVTRGRRDI